MKPFCSKDEEGRAKETVNPDGRKKEQAETAKMAKIEEKLSDLLHIKDYKLYVSIAFNVKKLCVIIYDAALNKMSSIN